MTAFEKAWYVLKNVRPESQVWTGAEARWRDPKFAAKMREIGIESPMPKAEVNRRRVLNTRVGPEEVNVRYLNNAPIFRQPNIIHHYNEEGDFHDDDLYVEQFIEQLAYQQDQERQQKLQEGVEMENPGNVSPYRYPRGGHR